MRSSLILTSLVAFSSLSSAWPWPPSLRDFTSVHSLDSLIVRRQDKSSNNSNNSNNDNAAASSSSSGNNNDNNSNQDSQSTQAPNSSAAPSNTDSNSPSSTPDSNNASNNDNANSTITSTSGNSMPQNTSNISIDPSASIGSIMIINPAITAGPQYYKVGNTISWTWNYTNLVATPSAIDILATVTPAGGKTIPSPYTLALNESWSPTQTFKWDSGDFNSKTALPVGTYTLIVYDAAAPSAQSSSPTPGFLATWNQLYFGMYPPQQYTPLADPLTVCATCNAAGSRMERLTLRFLFGMVSVTIGSLLWFAGGWGVL